MVWALMFCGFLVRVGKEPFVNPHFINIDENELDFMAEMGCNFGPLAY